MLIFAIASSTNRSIDTDPEPLVSMYDPLSMLDSTRRAHALAAALVWKDLRFGENPLRLISVKYLPALNRIVAIQSPPSASYVRHEHLRQHKKYRKQQLTKLAEREGFEPSVRLTVHTLSKRAP
jgi:hypothetical protein